jgi:hypothetical protein
VTDLLGLLLVAYVALVTLIAIAMSRVGDVIDSFSIRLYTERREWVLFAVSLSLFAFVCFRIGAVLRYL